MNDAVIADLKRFIDVTVSQRTADLATKEDVREIVSEATGKLVDEATNKILEAIGDTMSTHDEAVDEQLADHDRRLSRLEQKPSRCLSRLRQDLL